jgi:hypothetical protein
MKTMLREMTRMAPERKPPIRRNPLLPKSCETKDISKKLDLMFESVKTANKLRCDIESKYNNIITRMIPKLNSLSRTHRRSAKWLVIDRFQISIDENCRVLVYLNGSVGDDASLKTLLPEQFHRHAFAEFKHFLNISELWICGKDNRHPIVI